MQQIKKRLPNEAFIFRAIDIALDVITKDKSSKFIFSDSISALISIKNKKKKLEKPFIVKILWKKFMLLSRLKKIFSSSGFRAT